VSIQLIRNKESFSLQAKGCVASIGNFDGVHRGHQILLERLKARSYESGLPCLVMIFEPQPAEFFGRGKAVPRLTRFREKFYYLTKMGVEKIWVMRFNAALAALTADEFIEHILGEKLRVKHLIVGEDFRFGYQRHGDVNLLKERGQRLDFTVEIMPSVQIAGERVSSTRIRQALNVADHVLAERLLGRAYCMLGRVVYGDQLGRVLGFPTANIYLHRQETPVKGIYVVRLHGIAKKGLPGVANVGIRPTLGGTRTLLEVHIFDFEKNIYGRQVKIEFCKKLREEEWFANLDLLKEQMIKDATQARNYFMSRGEL
jgi:riboflavin kinase/FMN adenylyltransferase